MRTTPSAGHGPRVRTAVVVGGALVIAAIAAAAPPSPPSAQRPGLRVSPLRFVPTDTEEVLEKRGVVPAGGPPFEIAAALDGRSVPHDLIGENQESRERVPVYTTDSVAGWVTKTLTETFRDWGAPSVVGSSLVLDTEIVKLFVVEENTYQAETVMKFTLRRRDAGEIWAGMVGGSAARFGRSLKPDNYNEVMSDALFACYSKLWTDPGFRQAWSGKTEGKAGEATGASRPSQILAPEIALKKLLELKEAGFEEETLVGWVKKISFTRPLTAEDMLEWKKAGVPQSVIRAAME